MTHNYFRNCLVIFQKYYNGFGGCDEWIHRILIEFELNSLNFKRSYTDGFGINSVKSYSEVGSYVQYIKISLQKKKLK